MEMSQFRLKFTFLHSRIQASGAMWSKYVVPWWIVVDNFVETGDNSWQGIQTKLIQRGECSFRRNCVTVSARALSSLWALMQDIFLYIQRNDSTVFAANLNHSTVWIPKCAELWDWLLENLLSVSLIVREESQSPRSMGTYFGKTDRRDLHYWSRWQTGHLLESFLWREEGGVEFRLGSRLNAVQCHRALISRIYPCSFLNAWRCSG